MGKEVNIVMKECVLYDRKCTDCGQCEKCDLDSNKICDNCCKCLEEEIKRDYHTIEIDEVITEED